MFYYCFYHILPTPENIKINKYKEIFQYCIQHLWNYLKKLVDIYLRRVLKGSESILGSWVDLSTLYIYKKKKRFTFTESSQKGGRLFDSSYHGSKGNIQPAHQGVATTPYCLFLAIVSVCPGYLVLFGSGAERRNKKNKSWVLQEINIKQLNPNHHQSSPKEVGDPSLACKPAWGLIREVKE